MDCPSCSLKDCPELKPGIACPPPGYQITVPVLPTCPPAGPICGTQPCYYVPVVYPCEQKKCVLLNPFCPSPCPDQC